MPSEGTHEKRKECRIALSRGPGSLQVVRELRTSAPAEASTTTLPTRVKLLVGARDNFTGSARHTHPPRPGHREEEIWGDGDGFALCCYRDSARPRPRAISRPGGRWRPPGGLDTRPWSRLGVVAAPRRLGLASPQHRAGSGVKNGPSRQASRYAHGRDAGFRKWIMC